MDYLSSLLFAAALGSTGGLRMSMPPMALALGAQTPFYTLPESAAWLGSGEALSVLLLLNLLELGAFSVPILGSGLDVVALGGAPLSSALVAAFAAPELNVGTTLFIAGVPAVGIQVVTSGARAVSGPFAPIVSLFETISSFILGILAVILPILALGLAVWLAISGVKRAKRYLRTRRERANQAPPPVPPPTT
ncbi:MAG: DUF4126 domain-containing protein [Deinococcota bacterium]